MAALNAALDDLAPLRAAVEAAPQDGAKVAPAPAPAGQFDLNVLGLRKVERGQ
jgi:hypothetical protein